MDREDQQRINLFARKNARLTDIKEKIVEKEVSIASISFKSFKSPVFLQKELQNIEDASDELMMADSDQPTPYPKQYRAPEIRALIGIPR